MAALYGDASEFFREQAVAVIAQLAAEIVVLREQALALWGQRRAAAALAAASQISPNPCFGDSSFRTDCIIQSPMIFFR